MECQTERHQTARLGHNCSIPAEITVDSIEVARFVYLVLHNEKIRDVIDTITSKVVLILSSNAKRNIARAIPMQPRPQLADSLEKRLVARIKYADRVHVQIGFPVHHPLYESRGQLDTWLPAKASSMPMSGIVTLTSWELASG